MSKIGELTKKYLSVNERFADLINCIVYDGKQTLKPDDLTEYDLDEEAIPYWLVNDGLFQEISDLLENSVAKRTKDIIFVFVNIGNKANANSAVIVQNMLCNAVGLAAQEESISEARIDPLNSNEQSWYKLLPVITFTLYWGTQKWDRATSLHEMYGDLDPVLKEKLPDYGLNLISPADMDEETISRLKTELSKVFEIIHTASKGKSGIDHIKNYDDFSELSVDARQILEELPGIDLAVLEKGTVHVSKAMQELQDSIAKIEIKGMAEVIKSMMDTTGKSFEDICKKTNLPKEKMDKVKEYLETF